MEVGQKRAPEESAGEGDAKKARVEEAADAPAPEQSSGLGGGGLEEDDFDALLDGVGADGLGDLLVEPPVPPEEAGRRAFVDRLGPGRVTEGNLGELLALLRDEAPGWGRVRRWRSSALLLVYVARASRLCRAAFVAEGLPLLGALLQEAIAALESGEAVERQEAGMWTLACLMCLRSLPLGRATLWEHRTSVGKPFDRLHRWCGRERSALAAELRAPTELLCRRWRRQPKPVGQDHAPEHKAVRKKVIEVIGQGLMGIGGTNSPASPAPLMSPGLPPPVAAAEVEMALYAKYSGPTAEYKQHSRMLRSNLALQGNADLRARVLSGEITAEELVAMDSSHLAPEAVQEARRAQLRKALKADIVTSLVPRMEKEEGDTSPGHHNYAANTAPPVWVAAPEPALPRRNSSLKSLTSEDSAAPAADASEVAGAGAPAAAPAPLPPVPALVPPPTPFQEGAAAGTQAHHEAEPPTPDIMATPAPDDEDEEEAALVRYLSNAP